MTRLEARTAVAPRPVNDFVGPVNDFDTGSPFDDPTPNDPTRSGGGIPTPPPPGGGRIPIEFDFDFGGGRDELEADFAAADALINNPTRTLGEVSANNLGAFDDLDDELDNLF